MTQYALFHTDAWLSYNSFDLIAVCTSPAKAIALARKHARMSGNPLDKEDAWDLENLHQTQGREYNYQISQITANTLF